MSYMKTKLLHNLISLLLIRNAYSRSIFFKNDPSKDAESVAECIRAIANGDSYSKSSVIISNCEYTDDGIIIIDDYVNTLTEVLARAYIPQIVIPNKNFNKTVGNYVENILIVFIINSCNCLAHLNETVNKNYKYLIVVNDELKQICNINLTKIGHTLQHHDATFMIKDTNNVAYKLLTTIPEICGDTCEYNNKVSLTHLNTCTAGKLRDFVVFPNKKPENLKKCEIKVGIATMYPYAIAKNRDSLQNLQQLSEIQIRGSDVEIIKIISNCYNASVKWYYIFREEENPFLHPEFIMFVINGSLDACAGGLYRIYGDLVYYSGIYTTQTVTWVYAMEREPRSWQTAVRKINGVYTFILFYIGYSIVWILCCNFDNISVNCKNIFLYSWGALIGASSILDAITWKQKMLNISYLLLCVHLSTYINVQLYSHLTIEGPPETLKTNDDVMESRRTPYLNNEGKYFIKDAKYVAFANTSENCVNFRDCEQKMLLNKGLTVLIEAYFHRLQASTAIAYEAQVMRAKENIYVVYHEMIVRKDTPFAGKFKRIVRRLFEAGICEHLYLEAIGLYIEGKAKNANANIMANSYKCEYGCAIKMSQIIGVLYVWLIGCFLSFVIFVTELVMNKKFTFDTPWA